MKRFYKEASMTEQDGRFVLLLDNKPVLTPMQNPFILPNEEIAERVVAEWHFAEEIIIADDMPVTRFMSTVIDRIIPERETLSTMLISYMHHDGLCYFADNTDDTLYQQQIATRQPVIDKFNDINGLDIKITRGIMPITQSDAAEKFAKEYLETLSALQFAIFYQFVVLSGSFILAVLTFQKDIEPDIALQLSEDEQTANIEKWGDDEELKLKRLQIRKEWAETLSFWQII
ncbi:MAG: ATP12 family protein [Pseudomonadota bacterium]